MVDVGDVVENLRDLRARISGAGGVPGEVAIVAVTKGFGADAVEAAVGAGLADLGESYAQELEAKAGAVTAATAARCQWHFLGHVQRNKVRRISAHVHLWQSVDRPAAGQAIASHAPAARVLVQVNVSGEAGKNGCRFEDAPALVDALATMGLEVRGLMAVGPSGPPELARPGFRKLTELADRLGLPERSMGMTHDLEVAVQEGTTMVRVGRALFGDRRAPARDARSEPSDLRR